MVLLKYDGGSLLIYGEVGTPYGQWDPRVGAFRAMGMYYREVLRYLDRSGILYKDEAADPLPTPTLSSHVRLERYQREALEAWLVAGKRGVIVLPTGSGKTFVALKAIEALSVATIVVVPTLDLVDQWARRLSEQFGVEVGVCGGGECVLKPLTVATYDSAYMKAETLGNRFLFLVLDEVHHAPSSSYRQIAEMYIAPYRMGLTATYERADMLHMELPRLVGDLVYRLDADALAGTYLSPYTSETVFVDLTPEERAAYERDYGVFKEYLRRKGIVLRSPLDFQKFIMRTGRDPEARNALLARNRALKTVLNSEAKLKTLANFLDAFKGEKVLVFTRYNQLVYRISKRFLIPAITYQTSRDERRMILSKFKLGEYRAVVTSQVLDEGVDVPDASVGIILSGTGSVREYVQRLGRILRKVEGKQAKLIEIVCRKTLETRMSRRRRKRPFQPASPHATTK